MKRIHSLLALMFLAVFIWPVTAYTQQSDSVDAAMEKFLDAVRNGKSESALTFISSSGLGIKNTLGNNEGPTRVIKRSQFHRSKGWINNLFTKESGDEPDTLGSIIKSQKEKTWKKVTPTKFIPATVPEYMDASEVYIEWKREGTKWVIAQVGWPES